MNNVQIADSFDQVADLLEFQGANPFRIRAYRNGARTLRDLAEAVELILDDPDRTLTEIDGIGKDLAEKCGELVATGQLSMLDELLAEIPGSVLDMLRIPGLGPKKAAVLYNELGISTLAQLQQACDAGDVRQLKGFAAKTELAILDGIRIAEAANQRILWSHADTIAQELLDHMRECRGIEQMQMAGSYRRGRETVGDLDLLVVSGDTDEVMDRFEEFPRRASTIARGGTKMSLRLESGLAVDLRVVPAESFGAALQYFTGSKDHNVVLRGQAKARGLKVNEYGVFRTDGEHEEYVAGAAEAEVYAALDLPVFAPELREDRGEFRLADEGRLPELIEVEDIRGDLHMHTTESDGKATLEEMVSAARQLGLKYIAITDHSQRVSMAGGLNPQRLLQQWEAIDALNDSLGKGFTVLKGIECDILEKGGMDLPDDVLRQGDWVIASVHYGQKQSRQQITDRIVGALRNPHVAVVAHPTGRLLNRREPYEVDLDAVFQAASEQGKLLELNANPQRLDLNDVYCAAARDKGIPIVISTDAHSVAGLDALRYGILQARRGGLSKKDVANTRTWPQLKKLLGR
jgi:DNA polymerase (family 10)